MLEEKKKFKVVTLGCRTNQYESAAYAKQLKELGYIEAMETESADFCIVNTCTVTEGADRSSKYQIRQLGRQNPQAKIVVTGCLADRLPQEIGEMPEVFSVVTNKEKEYLVQKLFPEEKELPEFCIDQFPGHTRAFVKVQDGCDSFCTYCILPYVRGRSKSRAPKPILEEVKTLVANGYKEIVITGINVGDYDGGEDPTTLADLVKLIDQVEGVERLRVSSIDPDEVDDALLGAVIEGRVTCHSMHIVLQSGSNAILKKMNRKYTRQVFLDTIARLKAADSDFTFTTDVIVGFPGESDEDFEETLALIKEVQFTKVHMFPYSRRARTKAALYPNQVPVEKIQERKQKVLRLSEQVAFDLRASYVGRKMDVLIETSDSSGYFSGHTDNFLEVLVKGDLASNQIVKVDCLENTPKGLIGCIST